jgi:hypothetical protein
MQKLQWNLSDYRSRLMNRFRNELGAHAGFSEKELSSLMGARFTDIRLVTSDYLRFKYGGRLPRLFLRAACSRFYVEWLRHRSMSWHASRTNPRRAGSSASLDCARNLV